MNTKTITPIHVCDLIAHETVSLLSVLDEDAVPPAQWMRDGLALYAAAHQLEEETARHLNWIDDEIQRIRQTAAGQELILLIGDEQLVRTAGLPMQIEAVRELLHTTAQLESVESRTALLELASGFDGELTLRENAYLRGAMLGYSRKFMDETYDSIIEFAELKSFEDRPFRQLSSGMKSRLAFSIASLVQPDILILDEVLSVGDGAFRKKSEAKMREIIHGGAATILVSHSLSQVREMCSKVLWLHRGRQIDFGDTAPICDRYQAYLEGELTL